MLRHVRQQKICDLLNKYGNMKTTQLAEKIAVSEMTIRRDLDELGEKGYIKRVFGGAVVSRELDAGNHETTFIERVIDNLSLKKEIAISAVELIEKNSSIFLDGSTTCNELAKIMPGNLNITIFTNSLEVLFNLRFKEGIKIVSLGGELAFDKNTLDGHLTIENSEKYSVDLCFFSARAYTTRNITNASMMGTSIKKTMLNNANKSYLLADSTKYGHTELVELCKWNVVESLITDSNLTSEAKESLLQNGIKVRIGDK